MPMTEIEQIIRCPVGCRIDSVTRYLDRPAEYSCGHLDMTALVTVAGYRATIHAELERHRDEAARIIAAHRAA